MSNLIKSSYVVSLDDLKRLELIKKRYHDTDGRSSETDGEPSGPDEETQSLRDQILHDAEAMAEERLRQATELAEQLKRNAEEEIEGWWQGRRALDLETAEAARQAGFEQGYAEGRRQAEEEAAREWESRLNEARSLLESAYMMKEQIIQEAEPFLVELSTAIAEKVIARKLESSQELVIELIRKSLSRRREQGAITLCVAPAQLAFVQAAREELSLAIDSQAELQIVPDASVKDYGCVIRSSFGSIDGRIDTQLEEIKRALLQIAANAEERRAADDGHSA